MAEAKGAKKIIRLKVSGAFHSSLMKEAKDGLRTKLASVLIKSPSSIFAPNALGKGETNPDVIRNLLGEQLTSPVRWIETMQYARAQGIQRFIELGPGRVLKGLAKRIDPALEVFSFEKISDIETVESFFQKASS